MTNEERSTELQYGQTVSFPRSHDKAVPTVVDMETRIQGVYWGVMCGYARVWVPSLGCTQLVEPEFVIET